MRKTLVLLGISGLLLGGAALAQGALPYWAYPVPKPGPAPAKLDNSALKSLPGTKVRFTEAGVNDRFNVPDCPERVHWDEAFALEVGAPGAYDYGPERCSWLTHHLTNWIGDDGFLRQSRSSSQRQSSHQHRRSKCEGLHASSA